MEGPKNDPGVQKIEEMLSHLEVLTQKQKEVTKNCKYWDEKANGKLAELKKRENLTKKVLDVVTTLKRELDYHLRLQPILNNFRNVALQAQLKAAGHLSAEHLERESVPLSDDEHSKAIEDHSLKFVKDWAKFVKDWADWDDERKVYLPLYCQIVLASQYALAFTRFCIPDFIDHDYSKDVFDLKSDAVLKSYDILISSEMDLNKTLASLFTLGNVNLLIRLYEFIKKYGNKTCFIDKDDERERDALNILETDFARPRKIFSELFSSMAR